MLMKSGAEWQLRFMASGMNIVRRFKRKKVLLEWIVEELALE